MPNLDKTLANNLLYMWTAYIYGSVDEINSLCFHSFLIHMTLLHKFPTRMFRVLTIMTIEHYGQELLV